MKHLFFTLFFLSISLSYAQTTVTVSNNSCEGKEVTVFFDDPIPACITATPVTCTVVHSITQTLAGGDVGTFAVPCSLEEYEVYVESVNCGICTAAWVRPSCGSSYPGPSPAADNCTGPTAMFRVDKIAVSAHTYEINNY